jgi:hypothetical protein
MRFKLITLTLFLASTNLYAASKMVERDNQEVLLTPADQSQIIFIRPSGFGGMVKASVFDINSGEPEFIGIVAAGKKIDYFVEPGKHTFMVISENADFMEANVAAGETYYSVITVRTGWWKARFSLHPARNGSEGRYQIDSEKFQKWLVKTEFVENTEASFEWAEANNPSIVRKQKKYWKKWETISAEDLAERTLEESDGF